MSKTIKFLIENKDDGERIDIYLSKKIINFTRSYIKKLIKNNNLKINKKTILLPSTKIKYNDSVEIKIIEKKIHKLKPKNIKLNIIFEDSDILVIDKPKGMVVHPGAGNHDYTLANALHYKYKDNLSDINGKLRPGIVHRIDKETSGLLVIAKNNFSHANLSKQFSEHSIKRKYICLIWGFIRPLNGRIQTFLKRSKKNRQLMSVSETQGKKAITNYKTIKVFNINSVPKISLLECELETGRTHQIRVHMKYKKTSIIGDEKYGKKNPKFRKVNENFLRLLNKINGQALHAKTLEFTHPIYKKRLNFRSNLPSDFKNMLNLLNKLQG